MIMQHIIHTILKYKKVYICVLAVYAVLFVSTAYTLANKAVHTAMNAGLTSAYDTQDNSDTQTPTRTATQLPPTFRGAKPNALSYPDALAPLFLRMRAGESLRILQIGDSHVRGNYLPNACAATLQQQLGNGGLEGVDMDVAPALDGGIIFDYQAQNGAHASRYCEPDKMEEICAWQPDLVIVSFGTNEAHGHFDPDLHQQTLRTLVDKIRSHCPRVCFLFTTPPGSYITTYGHRWRDRRGRWHYNTAHNPNPQTEEVARAIDSFARQEHHACWNLFEIAGGSQYATTNWRNGGYMQADCIHYTAAAYELQGRLLGEAIALAYEQSADTP